ncbi:uncharacterized protein LOC123225582 [Mangifera indica]|uniref:uncharacterized protein LOC123225582 n=1 Tax=Mangifera indica TaxID=29780 RepID=UPI001CFB3B3F|nr:uncharacterized protein LOC123225582 [Mangifera indica]XP_044505585.1 uncharacterized protein LOC123225582 [Mangifera indica]XP_044505586.1 uncharacterized protein LOC123225582 [Mangifera indica]XP_044505587.1 uncharacterized protein LOC123225582 [Mangifera indica]XP_044505588.1 uncharacterized protein LOC123225582 [Mangifera indica]XP_044505589.1 uncharacterized protein LOC123225582 [Mangifera indica]XP_044505590.1 uncharacterized protein LOC123225582 [Mangifera indica]XP_044505591.1 unc
MVLDSSSKVHSSSGAFQGWEQPTTVNKVPMLGLTNNQKRPLSASSSHAMAQWVGQRPDKNSRTRRANLVSPVLNNKVQPPAQSFSASDFGGRTSSFGANESLFSSSTDNNTPKIKREFENVSSPFGLSESEESGAGDDKLKEKGVEGDDGTLSLAYKVRSSSLPRGKNKILTNEIGDGVRKQGRNVGGLPLTRSSIHLMREKLENVPPTRPLQSMRPASDKIKSKTGCPPSKKLRDRKASVRVGLMLNNATSDVAGESDDDHEDLLAATNSACNASNLACSGKFWKKMESIFTSLSLEDMTFLKQQLSFSEELEETLSQIFGDEYKLLIQKMKKNLRKFDKAIQKGGDVERRNIEHGAMDQLIEIAYRKRMACQRNHASRGAVRKVSRQVAMAFVKRTLARCRKFEDTGFSCFSEPALLDVLFSAPPCSSDAKSADYVGSGTTSNTYNEVCNHQTEAKGSGAVCSTFKRYDSPSDNLDRGSSDAFQAGFLSSEHVFPKHGIILKKPKREGLIDDVVGSASSGVTSTLDNSNLVYGARGKKSEKDRYLNKDNYISISISLAGRSTLDILKNECKTRGKSKHKNNHSSTSVSGLNERSSVSRSKLSLASNQRSREVGLSSPGKISKES